MHRPHAVHLRLSGGRDSVFVDRARENPLGTISFPNLCGWDGGRLVRRVILDLAGT